MGKNRGRNPNEIAKGLVKKTSVSETGGNSFLQADASCFVKIL